MKVSLIILGGLFPLLSFGNTFSFSKRPYDFRLEISKDKVFYRSHGFHLNTPINGCKRPLAQALNLDLLSLAENDPNGTEAFLVDGKRFTVSKDSRFAKELASMDIKLRAFALELGKACSH